MTRGQAEIGDLTRTHKPNSAAETKGKRLVGPRHECTASAKERGRPRVYLWRSLITQQIRGYPGTILRVEVPEYHPGAHLDWWARAIADKPGGHSLSFWNKIKIKIMRVILTE